MKLLRSGAIAGAILLLSACNSSGGGSYSKQDAMDGANFRLQARDVYAKLNPICPFTQNANELARYGVLQQRYVELGEWVSNTPFTTDLTIIEAEYAAIWKTRSIECKPTDTAESLELMNAELQALDGQMRGLEKLAGMV